jgi:hypothetical protein
MIPATLIAVSVTRLGIFVLWLLLPIGLVVFAIRELRNSSDDGLRARWLPVIAVALLGAIWCSFVLFSLTGQIGGFGSHYLTTRLADWFLLGSVIVLVISIASKVAKGKLVLASLLVFALWFGSEMVA